MFYIVVACLKECTYDIRSYYATEYTLVDGEQTAFRWNGTSTNILRYEVPQNTLSGARTDRWTIKVDPEADFEQFEAYLSFDDQFNLVEESENVFLVDHAMIVQQTDRSSNWCRGCSIWLIVNTVGDKRVQITAEAINYNPSIDDSIPITAIILKN